MAMARIAAIQMTSGISLARNLERAAYWIQQASNEGAKLVVLPEMFPIFSPDPLEKVRIREILGEGLIQSFLSEQARLNNIWIVGGTIPLWSSDPTKIKAGSLIFNNEGRRVSHYYKIHPFKSTIPPGYDELKTMEPGKACDENIDVFDTPVGKVGLVVCYDIRYPAFPRVLAKRGAEIIIAPSAFTPETGAAHWDILTKAVAVQNLCYFVGSCQGGTHESGRKTYGHSNIISPWGVTVSEIADEVQGEGVIFADIDLSQVHEARRKLSVLEDSAFDSYKEKQPSSTIFSPDFSSRE